MSLKSRKSHILNENFKENFIPGMFETLSWAIPASTRLPGYCLDWLNSRLSTRIYELYMKECCIVQCVCVHVYTYIQTITDDLLAWNRCGSARTRFARSIIQIGVMPRGLALKLSA